MRATARSVRRARRRGGGAALTAVYVALSTVAFLVLQPRDAGSGLWFPPAGLAFGYLLCVGARGGAVVALALLGGGALAYPQAYAQAPAVAVGSDILVASWFAVTAHALRRMCRPEASYAVLTRFVLLGVVLAPLGSATAGAALGLVLDGVPVDTAAWARGVLGDSTAIVTLAPAFLLLQRSGRGAERAVRVPPRRRWELLAQALVVVLVPTAFLLTSQVSRPELVLMPIALVPLAWLAFDADHGRAAAVLAACGLALGAAAQLRFGNGEGTFELQIVMFSGAVAALFAAAGLATEARTLRGAELESRRWQALVESAPVLVARVTRDGRWHPEHPGAGTFPAAGPEEPADDGRAEELREVLERAARVPELDLALRSGAARTVQWGVDDDTGRRFVTRVTPLPDGQSLAVTTETTRLHSAEIALAWERSHDRETDLPNRDLLLATADQAVAEGLAASLILLDVDHATHRAALLDVDPARLVLVLAERIRGLLDPAALARGTALVARVGDDRFGVLVPEDVASARQRADRMIRAVRTPVNAGGAPVAGSAWAGIAPLDGERGARESLRRAEAALQAAAEHGRGSVAVLDGLSVRTSAERARLTGEVAHAVDRGELDVVFQPDVTLADGRLAGVEALVRWRRREGFAAPTETFVRLAEELGAVQAVDSWVMEESLRAMGAWRRLAGGEDLELGLNVSALSLTRDLPERLVQACARHGVPPGSVRLEVTETALADDGTAVDVLRTVRASGCRVALDDFGTGYATLSRLQRLPVDVLKLDRSFLPSLPQDASTQALVSLVLGLAGPLQVEVVAEGVETQEQREVLLDLGCRRAQGYLFSRPATAAAISAMIRAGGLLAGDPVREEAVT